MDIALFNLIHHGLAHPALDAFMPFFTNEWYLFALPVAVVMLVRDWKKGLVSILLVAIAVAAADFSGNQIKHLVERLRPCHALPDVRPLIGCGKSFAMPSNHAANAAASVMLLIILWRRHLPRFPVWAGWLGFLVISVGFSRVYLGVHYPSDVVVGTALGALVVWAVARIEPRLLGWRKPSTETIVLIVSLGAISILRLLFVLYGPFDLSGDEAHYWEWSRRLDCSYYSKGPVIAWLIRMLTVTFGHTEAALRTGAILFSSGTSILLYMLGVEIFGSRRAGLIAAGLAQITPIFAAYGIVFTIDPPFIFFWTLSILLFHRAIRHGRPGDWYGLGAVLGLGLLTKYTMGLFLAAGFGYLAANPNERRWLTRKEPWIAVLLSLVIFMPVVLWNASHDWVTFRHTAGHVVPSGFFDLAIDDVLPFIGSQLGVISPVLLLLLLHVGFQARRSKEAPKNMLFFLSIPVLVFFLLKSLAGKVQGNWPMEAYPALFLLLGIWIDEKWSSREGRKIRGAAVAAVCLALAMTIVLHAPGVVHLFTKRVAIMDKMMGWEELSRRADEIRRSMPKPDETFIVSDNYMVASELAFYMEGNPVTYNAPLGRRMTQYDLWPGYQDLVGRDAIFVIMAADRFPAHAAAWFARVEPVLFRVVRYGKEIQPFTLFRCYGFRGMEPGEVTSF